MNPRSTMRNIGFTGSDNDLIILSVKRGQKFALELFGVNGYIKKAGDAANTPGQAGQVPRLITVSTQVSAPMGMESSHRGDFVYRRLIQRATRTTRTPATKLARMSKRNCSIGASFQEDLPRSHCMKSGDKTQELREGALGVCGRGLALQGQPGPWAPHKDKKKPDEADHPGFSLWGGGPHGYNAAAEKLCKPRP